MPAYTTLSRVLHRLDETVLEGGLSAVVHQLVPQPSPQATVAVGATGRSLQTPCL